MFFEKRGHKTIILMGPETFLTVEQIKKRRVSVDALIQQMRDKSLLQDPDAPTHQNFDYELYRIAEYQALKCLIEGKMWLGKMLEGLGNPFPAELADKATIQ